MSPKRRKDVSQLVEKYRGQFPSVERPFLRKLIRLENPELFKNKPSNLKTLDRHLKRAFRSEKPLPKENTPKPSRFKIVDYLKGKRPDDDRRVDEALRLAYCDAAIRHEEIYVADDDPEYFKKINEIEYKWRKKYGLI